MAKTKLLLLALIASVAVNLFFFGGIISRTRNSPSFGMRPFPPNIGWIVRDLSEERRSELTALLQVSADDINMLRREMFDAQANINEIMSADEFDSAALESAFNRLRETNSRYQAMSHSQSIDLLSQLSTEERTMALEFIHRRGPRDSGRREGGFGGRGDFGGPPGGIPRGGFDGPGDRRPPPPDQQGAN